VERRSEASTLWLWMGGGEGVEEELFGVEEVGICAPAVGGDECLLLICNSAEMSII
jgi:hypothetical protein